jgi:hypothetical protein
MRSQIDAMQATRRRRVRLDRSAAAGGQTAVEAADERLIDLLSRSPGNRDSMVDATMRSRGLTAGPALRVLMPP